MWNDGTIWGNDDCDLYAVVYTSKDNEYSKRVKIYILQIFEYVKTRVNFIVNIIKAIESYQNKVILEFKNSHIKNIDEFDNYIDYLENLDNVAKERFGSEYWSKFDYIINLLKLKVSNYKNENKMKLYINALKYAVNFEYNALQNMSYVG